jgi:hypothetical protein
VSAILVVPGVIVAAHFHSLFWGIAWPVGLLAALIILGKITPGRTVTPQQFADELERHLLGTEGGWDWDDVTSSRIADPKLDRLRGRLQKFDTFALPEWENEFKEIIAALRRGEIPEVKDDY